MGKERRADDHALCGRRDKSTASLSCFMGPADRPATAAAPGRALSSFLEGRGAEESPRARGGEVDADDGPRAADPAKCAATAALHLRCGVENVGVRRERAVG